MRRRATSTIRAKRERKAPAGGIVTKCLDVNWNTPPELRLPVQIYFGGHDFLDPSTSRRNPMRAARFFVSGGLTREWDHPRVYSNPPYGKALKLWMAKTIEEATSTKEIISLLPCSRWEQTYMHEVLRAASHVCWIRKRVAFERAKTGQRARGNPYANMFLGFGTDWLRWQEAFGPIGLCQELRSGARYEYLTDLPKQQREAAHHMLTLEVGRV